MTTIPTISDIKVSKHVSLRECVCPHCLHFIATPAAMFLIAAFEKIRELDGGNPIRITSFYRCPAHNQAIGGSLASYHQFAAAMDLVPNHRDFARLERVARRIKGLGVLNERDHIHIWVPAPIPNRITVQ